jgi:hypothetical protein
LSTKIPKLEVMGIFAAHAHLLTYMPLSLNAFELGAFGFRPIATDIAEGLGGTVPVSIHQGSPA